MKIDDLKKRKMKRASAEVMKALVERLRKAELSPEAKAALSGGPRDPLSADDADAQEIRPYGMPVPREFRENLNRLAARLIDELQVDTPEKLATSLFRLGPKAMGFSQSIWFSVKSEGAPGPAEPEWTTLYEEIAGIMSTTSALVDDYAPQSDPWFLIRLTWMRDREPERLRELAKEPEKLVKVVDEAVQTARGVWAKAKKKMEPDAAKELALDALAPSLPPAEEAELPVAESEWEAILERVNTVPEESTGRRSAKDVT